MQSAVCLKSWNYGDARKARTNQRPSRQAAKSMTFQMSLRNSGLNLGDRIVLPNCTHTVHTRHDCKRPETKILTPPSILAQKVVWLMGRPWGRRYGSSNLVLPLLVIFSTMNPNSGRPASCKE